MFRVSKWQNSQPLTIRSELPPLQKTREFADSSDDIAFLDEEKPQFFGAIRTIVWSWFLALLVIASYFIYTG